MLKTKLVCGVAALALEAAARAEEFPLEFKIRTAEEAIRAAYRRSAADPNRPNDSAIISGITFRLCSSVTSTACPAIYGVRSLEIAVSRDDLKSSHGAGFA